MSKITIRIPDDVHEALQKASDNNHRSLNSEIVHALDYYLNNSPEAKEAKASIQKKK